MITGIRMEEPLSAPRQLEILKEYAEKSGVECIINDRYVGGTHFPCLLTDPDRPDRGVVLTCGIKESINYNRCAPVSTGTFLGTLKGR